MIGPLSTGDSIIGLAALLRHAPGPQPVPVYRRAAVFMLEPLLLLRFLPDPVAQDWLLLAASPALCVRPDLDFPDEAWGAAVRHLRATDCLQEDLDAWTWAPGPALDDRDLDTAGWPDDRAQFLWAHLEAWRR